MDLSFKIAGVAFEHPLMNGAGTVKTAEDVSRICHAPVSAVVLGSITMLPRGGNEGNVFAPLGSSALNALGLPNLGLVPTLAKLPDILEFVHASKKPLVVSVAGFDALEYGVLADTMLEQDADLVELNLSCPNVWEDGKQHRLACFDPGLVDRILRAVAERVGDDAPISVKLSPFSDPFQLKKVAEVLARSPLVKAVVCCNTFPSAFAYLDDGRSAIESPQVADGLAGLSGRAMKQIALGQVRQFRALLPERIAIIGAGGVCGGADVRDFLHAGATAVQCVTAYLSPGRPDPRRFAEILAEYVNLLGDS
jgi:dihydroorotate dehydrogenase (fumarate)